MGMQYSRTFSEEVRQALDEHDQLEAEKEAGLVAETADLDSLYEEVWWQEFVNHFYCEDIEALRRSEAQEIEEAWEDPMAHGFYDDDSWYWDPVDSVDLDSEQPTRFSRSIMVRNAKRLFEAVERRLRTRFIQ